MKKLILILAIIAFTVTPAFAKKLDPIVIPPEVIGDTVTQVFLSSLIWDATTLKVRFDWATAEGKVIKSKVCHLEDHELVQTPGSCSNSDSSLQKQKKCEREVNTWQKGVCDADFDDQTACEGAGFVWHIGRCSDNALTDQTTCLSTANVWTPAVMQTNTEFTNIDNLDGQNGVQAKDTLATAIFAVCAPKIGL